MNLNTRKTIRLWARRLPLLTVAASVLIAVVTYAGLGFVGVSPVWLLPLLMGFIILSVNSEIGALRPYGQETSLVPMLGMLAHVLLLAPLSFDAAMNVGLPGQQGMVLLLSMLAAMVAGIATMLALQHVVTPVWEAEKRADTLAKFEAEVALLENYGSLPEVFAKMVERTKAQAENLPLDELEGNTKRLSDYRELADTTEQKS